jgi:hypothetical protein
VHLSEVNSGSGHGRLSSVAINDFREVAHLVPVEAPVILETPVSREQVSEEIDRALLSLASPSTEAAV